MVLLPIVLGVRHSPDAEDTGKQSKSLVEQVLHRDNFSCRFCGFHSKQFQRLIPHPEAGSPAYATTCIFCQQCMLLEQTGVRGSGLLIWLPEIGQAELNHLVRAIYIARYAGKTMETSTLATRALDALTARRAEAKKRLGSDDPMLLATIMHENLAAPERLAASHKLEGVRLLPGEKYMVQSGKGDINTMPNMIKYWCSSEGPYGNKPISEWPQMFKKASEAVGHA